MGSDRVPRPVRTVVVIAVIIGLVTGGVLAAHWLSDPVPVDGEIPVSAANGPEIVIDTEGTYKDVNLEDLWNTTADLYIQTADGEIHVDGDDGASGKLAISDIEGTWTEVTSIASGNNWLYLDPGDKQRVGIRGDVDALKFRNVTVDDGTNDLEITGTKGGTAEVKTEGLSANTHLTLYEPNADEVVANGTTDANGNLTESFTLTSSTDQLQIRTAGDYSDPTLTNPDPTGTVTTMPSDLSVDVEADAWPADVEFGLEGSTVTTKTVSSNGTVSASINPTDLGIYDWNATITDATGDTDTLTAQFETPRNVTLREEHNVSQIIDNATVTMRFFTVNGDIAVERQTSNGTVNMTGLPDESFVIFAESTDHYDRRIFIESIFEQENMYLLNSTEFPRAQNEAIRSRFVYTDLTGDFPRDDTTVQIERAIDLNDNGTSQFRVVAGDFWGAAAEFQAILEKGVRYRIFVKNQQTGQEDIVGTHVPTEDLSHEIQTSGLVQEAQNATGVYANAELNASNATIQYVYRDPADETDNLTVRIYNESTNTEIHNISVSGPLGTYRNTISLNSDQVNGTWIVEFDAGDRHYSEVPVGHGQVQTPVSVPDWIMTLLMAMAVTFVGALYGPRTSMFGAWAMVFVAAGVAMFGWAFSMASVIVAGLVAVGATIYSETRADR